MGENKDVKERHMKKQQLDQNGEYYEGQVSTSIKKDKSDQMRSFKRLTKIMI